MGRYVCIAEARTKDNKILNKIHILLKLSNIQSITIKNVHINSENDSTKTKKISKLQRFYCLFIVQCYALMCCAPTMAIHLILILNQINAVNVKYECYIN